MVTVELKPGGADIPVTEENKKEYVSHVVEYRIAKRVKEQFEAFMSGFSELIPQDLINVFDERELELLIGGMSEIDVYVLLVNLCATHYADRIHDYLGTTGASSLITEDMRSMTRLYSGSGSACAAGHLSANPASFSSLRARRVFLSMDSKICKARMDLVASP